MTQLRDRRFANAFLSAVILAAWQISTPAIAQTAIDWQTLFTWALTDNTTATTATTNASSADPARTQTEDGLAPTMYAGDTMEDLDCVTSYDPQDQRAALDSSYDPLGNDDDEGASVAGDRAVIAHKFHLDTHPLLPSSDENVIIPRPPLFAVILEFPVHCFYSVHEHIRERAPPVWVVAFAKATTRQDA